MAFYHQISSSPCDNLYYTQNPYENGYNHYSSYSYYPPPQYSANFYCYEFAPTPSLIAYTYPDSIQCSVYRSVSGAPQLPEDEDLNFPDYDPQPYEGGYDIAQTYGKPLPPNDQICYPPSSVPPNLPSPTPVPAVHEVVNQKEQIPDKEEAQNLDYDSQLTEEEEEEYDDDDEEEDGGDDDDERKEEDRSMIVYEENNSGTEIKQIPHGGYGLEAFDLCENLFGYWPCLSKMNQKCGTCVGDKDDGDEWKGMADYLFGNPDPYRGWSDQGGHPSGYPLHVYGQMQYQYHPGHSSYVVYEQQADQHAQNSWFS